MSDQTIKLIAAGALLLHGIGHGGALGALTAATSDNREQRRADGANQDSSHRRSYLRHGS